MASTSLLGVHPTGACFSGALDISRGQHCSTALRAPPVVLKQQLGRRQHRQCASSQSAIHRLIESNDVQEGPKLTGTGARGAESKLPRSRRSVRHVVHAVADEELNRSSIQAHQGEATGRPLLGFATASDGAMLSGVTAWRVQRSTATRIA